MTTTARLIAATASAEDRLTLTEVDLGEGASGTNSPHESSSADGTEVSAIDRQRLSAAQKNARAAGGYLWIETDCDGEELADLLTMLDIHVYLPHVNATRGPRRERASFDFSGQSSELILHPVSYDDSAEVVSRGELSLWMGPETVVTRTIDSEVELGAIFEPIRGHLLASAVGLFAIRVLHLVVQEYDPVLNGLEADVDEVEDSLFADELSDGLSQRIFGLTRQVLTVEKAIHPLREMMAEFGQQLVVQQSDGRKTAALKLTREEIKLADDRVRGLHALLDRAITVHSTLVSQRQTDVSIRQNEDMKRISSWAAILFAPTLVGGIYGMNFDHMPELHWAMGYPFALGLMAAIAVALYVWFKRSKWL